MKTAKEKINNLLKSFSIKQLYFAAVLPLLILGYILIAFSVWNVYVHQMKSTLALETQNAIMNKADNFNSYFDSLYYATDSIIYSDITQQLLQKNVTSPSPDDQSLLTDILYNYMHQSFSSYVITAGQSTTRSLLSLFRTPLGIFTPQVQFITQRKSVQMNYSDC